MVRPVANARGYRGLALVLGILGGLFGAGVGWYVGNALSGGFRLDWYRYQPPVNTASTTVLAVHFVLGALLALALGTFSYSLAHREWARRVRHGVAPPVRSTADSRSTYGFQIILLLALLAPAGIGLLLFGFLALQGLSTSVATGDLVPLLAWGGFLCGAIAGYVPMSRAGPLLASGRLRSASDEDNVFAKIALFCGRRWRITIAVLLLTTVALGSGLTRLDTNVDVADVLPRGDPNTDAAHNLTSKFKSSFTLQVTFQLRTAPQDVYNEDAKKFLPRRSTAANYKNISDEVYVRAIDQLLQFVLTYKNGDQASPFVGSVALSDFYRIINWTLAGGKDADEAAYSLPSPASPEGAERFRLVDEGVWRVIPATADAVISPDFQQTAALVIVGPKETMGSKEIGLWALRLRQAYVAWAETEPSAYKVFTGANAPKFSVDLPLANAHSSELAARDFKLLLPILAVWIVITVFFAFRNWASIGIALSALALGVIWTFGLMGYMDIPLNTLNLTVIPLIMGVGIDYGIHTLNEYQEGRSEGLTNQQVFRRLGARGFLALFIATLNTVVGLAVMIVSPSLLIGQLGILACIAIAASFLITITFIPAALSALPAAKAREYRPSPLMASLARAVSGRRVAVVILILLLTGYALISAPSRLRIEEFGDPPRNWLDSDPLRREHEAAIQGFYNSPKDDVKANILIFEGDINNPAAHQYMDRLEATLKTYGVGRALPAKPGAVPECESGGESFYGTRGRVISDTLRTLPFLMRTYLAVKDGAGGAGGYTALSNLASRSPNLQSTDPYPRDRAALTQLMDEIHDTPLRGLANFFYDYPDDRMAMMLFSVRAATFEDAEEVWCQVQLALLANEPFRPQDLQVSFFGNTAINYLFVAKELPWVGYMSIIDNLLVMAFVYIPTRQWRPTLVVGILNFLASAWWLAILPDIGVGLAITLTLPLVFIYAIGSDYGLHLVLGTMATRNTEETFRTTGKAILFSGITTFGAFLIYTQMSNLAVRRTMIATAAAIPIIFLVTLLVVPLLYPVRKGDKGPAPEALPPPEPPPEVSPPRPPPAPSVPLQATKRRKSGVEPRRPS